MSDRNPIGPQSSQSRPNSHRSVTGHVSRAPTQHHTVRSVRQRREFIEPKPQPISDFIIKKSAVPSSSVPTLTIVKPQPAAVPASQRLQRSNVLQRQFVQPVEPHKIAKLSKKKSKKSRLQVALVAMACIVFVVGLGVSVQTFRTNRTAIAQVSALAKKSDTVQKDPSVPSATKPSTDDIKNYQVAPELARYIKIPKIGVNARVKQVGTTSKGAIDVPNNIHDAAWYTGSAKPGEVGATVLDGHVSGWNTPGVFHDIKTLSAGDTIQIVRGDGVTLNYRVVKSVTYDANKVDMQAAVNPVTPGKIGLNLITCDGQVQTGTNEYTKRVVVFTEKI